MRRRRRENRQWSGPADSKTPAEEVSRCCGCRLFSCSSPQATTSGPIGRSRTGSPSCWSAGWSRRRFIAERRNGHRFYWGGSVGLILGLFLFRLGGIGGADVKLLVGIGASVGFEQIFSLLFYIGVAGGIAALWTVLRGGREFAYLPAMALGFLIFLLVGG
ncbi:MAG: A24 family peptidase [Candidatus Manganitrophus sp.]|nr:MAG: A24 family peptidase [Candidatus Manganitrophus sp.]